MSLRNVPFLFFSVCAVVVAAGISELSHAQEQPPAPSESESPEERRAAQVSATRRKLGIPLYQLHRPRWGFELAAATRALQNNSIISDSGGKAYSVSVQIEYQPQFLQSFGVFGLGPQASLYPVSGKGVTSSTLGVWSVGGQVRYQARFFREQIIVPMAAFSAEMIRYHLASAPGSPSGRLMANGPVYGAYILLNPFDSSAAADFYVNTGVTRSYLVLEVRDLQGSSDHLAATEPTYYFGLRLEL